MARKSLETSLAKRQGGGKCQTCQHYKRKAIENLCAEFFRLRANGKTFLAFRNFVPAHITTKFNYPYDFRALKQHLEKCLGQKVP